MAEGETDLTPAVESGHEVSRLIYPDHRDQILSGLRGFAEERGGKPLVFRSAVAELEGDLAERQIIFDSDGLPQVKEGMIKSHAFAVGGWKKVQATAEELEGDIDLVARENAGFESPLLWTSTQIETALSFGPSSGDQVLMVIDLNKERGVFQPIPLQQLRLGKTRVRRRERQLSARFLAAVKAAAAEPAAIFDGG